MLVQTKAVERQAARLFTATTFKPVITGGNTEKITEMVRRIGSQVSTPGPRRADVLVEAYRILESSYRGEYVYRNAITSRIFVGRHKASNSALLHELRVGSSLADCVLVNGTAVVYEIKTEFDDPAKLPAQIFEYRKAFPEICVVVSEGQVERYMGITKEFDTSLISLTSRGSLSTKHRGLPVYRGLDRRAMFNLLRVEEQACLLREYYGDVPVFPNGRRYAEYMKLAESIPLLDFQSRTHQALKRRKISNSRSMLFDKSLSHLRAIITQLDPTEAQQKRLLEWLKGAER